MANTATDTTPEWIAPRVGEKVKLRDGRTVEVTLVRRCNDVLRLLTEDKAKMLGAQLMATYGFEWQSIYYEANAFGPRNKALTFRPNDVVEILDTRT